jgi:hypothetical protein
LAIGAIAWYQGSDMPNPLAVIRERPQFGSTDSAVLICFDILT